MTDYEMTFDDSGLNTQAWVEVISECRSWIARYTPGGGWIKTTEKEVFSCEEERTLWESCNRGLLTRPPTMEKTYTFEFPGQPLKIHSIRPHNFLVS